MPEAGQLMTERANVEWTLAVGLAVAIIGCATTNPQADSALAEFCQRLPRAAYASLEKHPTSDEWFEVYEVVPNTFAIYEPFQWQEVISYLIVGGERALLFDTGNGIGNIRRVVDGLTTLPVIVVNSHSHYDHIGGNHHFDDIRSVSTEFSETRSRGMSNADVAIEVSKQALCKGLPDGVTAESHRVRPYAIGETLAEGQVLDLGSRALEILRIPGHTDDSIALLERERGYLWSGDSFYEGPIWLYAPETDFAAYRRSLERLAALAPGLTAVFPAHNTPRADPALLIAALAAFDRMVSGEVPATPAWEGTVTYDFDGFGFLTRATAFPQKW